MPGDPSKYQAEAARRRLLLNDIRAKAQAHVTSRDREPAVEDRHLSSVFGSHRYDIRAAHALILELTDLFGDVVEDYGKRNQPGTAGVKGDQGAQGPEGPEGPIGPTGPQGPQGEPGECDCFDVAGNAAGSDADAAAADIIVESNANAYTDAAIATAMSTLIIENRTSDPGSPAVGRIWLRTDL